MQANKELYPRECSRGLFTVRMPDENDLRYITETRPDDRDLVTLTEVDFGADSAIRKTSLYIENTHHTVVGSSRFATPSCWSEMPKARQWQHIYASLHRAIIDEPVELHKVDDAVIISHANVDTMAVFNSESATIDVTLFTSFDDLYDDVDSAIRQTALLLAHLNSYISHVKNDRRPRELIIGSPLINTSLSETNLAIEQLAGQLGVRMEWGGSIDSKEIAQREPKSSDHLAEIAKFVIRRCHTRGVIEQRDIIDATTKVLALHRRERGENNHRD